MTELRFSLFAGKYTPTGKLYFGGFEREFEGVYYNSIFTSTYPMPYQYSTKYENLSISVAVNPASTT